jgi:hypothetical protein
VSITNVAGSGTVTFAVAPEPLPSGSRQRLRLLR